MRKLSEIKRLKFKGPHLDDSGLGQASRDLIPVLPCLSFLEDYGYKAIDISSGPQHTIPKIKYNLELRRISQSDANFIFCPPYQFNRFVSKSKLNIGYTVWETDKVPDYFIDNIRLLDALLVPCEDNYQLFKKHHSRVFKLAHAFPETKKRHYVTRKSESQIQFYSIFEWYERKSPVETFQAYFLEFTGQKDVKLIVKARGPMATQANHQINMLKAIMKLPHYPDYQIICEDWNEDQLAKLHRDSHCYVSLSKGEGWCLPIIDAMLCGNTVISTHPNGCTEYIDDLSGFFPVRFYSEPLIGMAWFNHVNATHNWKVPSVNDARVQFRLAYKKWKQDRQVQQLEYNYNIERLRQRISKESLAKQLEDIILNN